MLLILEILEILELFLACSRLFIVCSAFVRCALCLYVFTFYFYTTQFSLPDTYKDWLIDCYFATVWFAPSVLWYCCCCCCCCCCSCCCSCCCCPVNTCCSNLLKFIVPETPGLTCFLGKVGQLTAAASQIKHSLILQFASYKNVFMNTFSISNLVYWWYSWAHNEIMSHLVSTCMVDHLRTAQPSRYVLATEVHTAFYLCGMV